MSTPETQDGFWYYAGAAVGMVALAYAIAYILI